MQADKFELFVIDLVLQKTAIPYHAFTFICTFFQKFKKIAIYKTLYFPLALGQQSVQNSSNTEDVLGLSGPKDFWKDIESWQQFFYWQVS